MGSITEIHKWRSKRNMKFCKHTEVENRKAEINNNNKKNVTSIWTKIHVYITHLSKHKNENSSQGNERNTF